MGVVHESDRAELLAEQAAAGASGGREIELIGHRAATVGVGRALPKRGAVVTLRANLRDGSVRFLLSALLCAQVADLVSTHIALARPGTWERNPLFRMLFQSLPGLADALKLGGVLAIAVVALSALPVPRSRHALLFAAGISMVAPIANVMTLLGRL